MDDESALDTDLEETDEEASDSDDSDDSKDSDEEMTEVEAEGEGVTEASKASVILEGVRKSDVKLWTGLQL